MCVNQEYFLVIAYMKTENAFEDGVKQQCYANNMLEIRSMNIINIISPEKLAFNQQHEHQQQHYYQQTMNWSNSFGEQKRPRDSKVVN